jgi:hypothetical protein
MSKSALIAHEGVPWWEGQVGKAEGNEIRFVAEY